MEKKYIGISLNEYLERYLVFEADFLTDDVKNVVDVTNDDCYMLVYGYCGDKGRFKFMVLAIGNSIDNCTKGLDNPLPLIQYDVKDLLPYAYVEVDPSAKAKAKCEKYLSLKDPLSLDDTLRIARRMPMFDGFRNVDYPDVIKAELIDNKNAKEVLVRISDTKDFGVINGHIIDSLCGPDGREVKLFPSLFDEEPCIIAMYSEHVKIVATSIGDLLKKLEELDDSTADKIDEIVESKLSKMKYRC